MIWENISSLVKLLGNEDLISDGSLLLQRDSPETPSNIG